MKRPILALLFLGLVLLPVRLAAQPLRLPDNHSVRERLADVITAPTNQVLATPGGIYRDVAQGTSVKFQVMTQQSNYYLLFTNEAGHRFPLDSKGSYIIKRSEHNGTFVQVKIFLNGNPNSFVRIFPMGERSRMDVFMFGFPMYTNITVPLRFRQILTDPFAKIIDLTEQTLNWSLILPERPLPEDRIVEGMVQTVQSKLSPLAGGTSKTSENSAYFKELRALSHGAFDCTGFAKWVVDGLYRPRTGRLISMRELEKKHVAIRGNAWSSPYEKKRDPFFGLDWSRNLALALTRLNDPVATPRTDDVSNIPFFSYTANVGYPIAHLNFILYELATRNPGYIYLGAVNREYGTKPVLREYTHVFAIFPYFDSSGLFHAVALENGVLAKASSLSERFAGDYIHLVRLRASSSFSPPVP